MFRICSVQLVYIRLVTSDVTITLAYTLKAKCNQRERHCHYKSVMQQWMTTENHHHHHCVLSYRFGCEILLFIYIIYPCVHVSQIKQSTLHTRNRKRNLMHLVSSSLSLTLFFFFSVFDFFLFPTIFSRIQAIKIDFFVCFFHFVSFLLFVT